MKGSISTCSGAADNPGRPGVPSCSWSSVHWPVLTSSVPVHLSATVHKSMDYSSNRSLTSARRWRSVEGGEPSQICTRVVFCGRRAVKRPEGCGLSGFRQLSVMECELLWVQITLTDSGPPLRSPVWKLAVLPRQQRERLFKRNILSFSLIHCSWRFGTLLLNCSCYGYQHLYQQPLERRSPCISRASFPHRRLLGDSVLLLHPQYQTCKCARLSLLCRSSQPNNFLLKSLFAPQNKTWYTFLSHLWRLPH